MGKPLLSSASSSPVVNLSTRASFPLYTILLLFTLRLHAVQPICSNKNCNCQPVHPLQLINATCTFDSKQVVVVTSSGLPDKLLELEVQGGRELRLSPEAFSRTRHLHLVRLRKVGRVVLRQGAFLNLTTSNLHLQLFDCGTILLEKDSLKIYRGRVSAEIDRAGHVVFQRSAFHKLLTLTIRNVPCLELLEAAFHLQPPETGEQPSATILLDNVVISDLPRNAFPSALAELVIQHSEVRTISGEAINSIFLRTLRIVNCSLHRLEGSAFARRSHIENLEIVDTRIRIMATNAVNSGISVLALRHNRISEIQEAGFNTTVASIVLINNTVDRIRGRGFTLTNSDGFQGSWRQLEVENNTFRHLDSGAINAPFVPSENLSNARLRPTFTFKGNFIGRDSGVNVFNVSLTDDIKLTLGDNYFGEICHCNMSTRVKELVTGSDEIGDELFAGGKCTLNSLLSACLKVPLGYMYMQNFTEVVCNSDPIKCEQVPADEAELPPHIPGINPDTLFDDIGVQREKQLLHLIFAFVVCGMCVMMLFSATMWLYRNEYFTKGRLLLLLSTESLLNLLTRMFNRSTVARSDSTHSISRVSVHEYAELHGQKTQQEVLDPDELFPSEDKATQTLPEELTQELLQTLREKLDDPENYSEARDMIEHLYDLIKVEESCNQNYHGDAVINFEDFEETENHVYDEINPKTKNKNQRQQRDRKDFVSVGTRAPSPDKLLPMKVAYGEARRRSMMLGEYAEPKDRKETAGLAHEYSELPAAVSHNPPKPQTPASKPPASPSRLTGLGDTAPKIGLTDKTDTKQNVYVELPHSAFANRPLPKKPGQEDPGEGPSTSST